MALKALSTHCCGVHPLLCAAWQGGLCAALGLAPGGMVPMVEPEYVLCYGNSLICFEGVFFFLKPRCGFGILYVLEGVGQMLQMWACAADVMQDPSRARQQPVLFEMPFLT